MRAAFKSTSIIGRNDRRDKSDIDQEMLGPRPLDRRRSNIPARRSTLSPILPPPALCFFLFSSRFFISFSFFFLFSLLSLFPLFRSAPRSETQLADGIYRVCVIAVTNNGTPFRDASSGGGSVTHGHVHWPNRLTPVLSVSKRFIAGPRSGSLQLRVCGHFHRRSTRPSLSFEDLDSSPAKRSINAALLAGWISMLTASAPRRSRNSFAAVIIIVRRR